MLAAHPGRLALVSPASLANYAACLADGFSEIEQPFTQLVAPASLPAFASGADGKRAAWASFLGPIAGAGVVITQLHGAHSEAPVLFAVWAHLRQLQAAADAAASEDDSADSVPALIVIVHRPGEVLERHQRGLYRLDAEAAEAAAAFSASSAYQAAASDVNAEPCTVVNILRGPRVACVLLGEASRGDYEAFLGRPVHVIPHGFFKVSPSAPPSPSPSPSAVEAATGAAATASPVAEPKDGFREKCVVGAVTTWSDMRWLSDLLKLHAACAQLPGATDRLLFVAAGSFKPYSLPGGGGCGERGGLSEGGREAVVVDELAHIRAAQAAGLSSCAVAVIEGSDLEAACDVTCEATASTRGAGAEASTHAADADDGCPAPAKWVKDMASLRSWLWRGPAAKGARVVVVASRPRLGTLAAELLPGLVDLNVQLYRELLGGFLSKVSAP